MSGDPIKIPKLTVADLADAKGFTPEYLVSLDLFEAGSAVCIPYGDGARPRMRAIDAEGNKKVWWAPPKKLPIRPYGRFRDEVEDARSLGFLLLVEGESDCWTAWLHGFPALGVPGATMAQVLQLEDIEGVEKVYVVEETDAGGRKFIDGTVRRFAELRQEHIARHGSDEGFPSLFRVRLPDGINDLNELHLLHRDRSEAFRAAVDAALADAEELSVESVQVPDSANSANTATEEWSPPIPLRHFDPPPFPVKALSPWLHDYVEAEAVATQTPLDLAGSLVLAAVAAAVARRVVIEPRPGWIEPLNIYTVVVLASGSRKTGVFKDVINPINQVEEIAVAAAQTQIAVALEEQEQLKRELRDVRKQVAAGDAAADVTYDLAARLAAHDIPEVPRLIADDVTSEQLEVLLERHGGRMAVFAAEGDVFDLMAGRYSRSGVLNIGVFLKAHAGDTIRVDRVGRGPVMVHNPTLTMGLAVQPAVIDGLAARPEFRGRGLTPRFLYSLPESNIGRRENSPPPMTHQVRSTYEATLTDLFDSVESTDDDGVEFVTVLHFDDVAMELFDVFRAEIEPRLGPGGDLSDMAEWGSKLPGAVARIAGLLHLADGSTEPKTWTEPVSVDVVERAITLGRYFILHARAAFALMGADPAVADAVYILDRLVARKVASFSTRDLFEGTKGRFKKVKNLEPGLALLEEHGHIRFRPPPEKKGPGRPPSPVFDVNPLSQNPHYSQNPGPEPPILSDEPPTGETREEGAA